MTIKQVLTIVFPDQVRQVISTPAGEQTVVITGQEAFGLMGGQVQSLPADLIEE